MTALTEFIESRLPMVRHALGDTTLPSRLSRKDFHGMSRYSVQQAFFYQLDWYIDEPVLMSEQAWAWVQQRYGAKADRFWSARRHAVPDFEKALPPEQRAGYSKLGILYEHVFTGTMFWEGLKRLHQAGNLTTASLESFITANYRTAWVHREENRRLPQSKRGATLLDAWQYYRRAGITLKTSPTDVFPYPAGGVIAAPAVQQGAAEVGGQALDLVVCTQGLVDASAHSDWPLVQVGGPLDPGTRHPGQLTTGFIPSAWCKVARYQGPHHGGHWSSGLPLVFWLNNRAAGFGLIAEVGPWHDPAQREHLAKLLHDMPWTTNREPNPQGTYWRFWRCNATDLADPDEALGDAWQDLSVFLPDVESALVSAGLLAG